MVEFAVELFGPDRLMFGRLFDQLPSAGHEAVLGGTAARFHALGAPAGLDE